MTISQLRSRVNALKRRFARELTIVQVRLIAEAVADHWPSSQPPDPTGVVSRFAKAGLRLTTYGRLHQYIDRIRRQNEVPEARAMLFTLLPWAGHERYDNFFRWDIPLRDPLPACPNLPAWV